MLVTCMKNYTVNILGFVSHMISGTTTPLSHCNGRAITDETHMNGCGWVSIKLYLQKQGGGWLCLGGATVGQLLF